MYGARCWNTNSDTTYTPKPTKFAKLKTALLMIWCDLPQEFVDMAIVSFLVKLRSCLVTAGGHFKRSV